MDASNSNEITRAYLDSIRIETRYLDGDVPDLSYYFCAQWFASPIMTAALSHLDRFMYPGAMAQYAEGAARANAVLWIGMTTDEAVPAMDKYLDDAYLAHLEEVRVIHGRGTGALRAAIHKELKRLKYVKEFRLGEYNEGGTGATVVVFKD